MNIAVSVEKYTHTHTSRYQSESSILIFKYLNVCSCTVDYECDLFGAAAAGFMRLVADIGYKDAITTTPLLHRTRDRRKLACPIIPDREFFHFDQSKLSVKPH